MQIVRRPLAPSETNHELLWLTVSSGGLALAATWLALKLPWPICLFHALTGHPLSDLRCDKIGRGIFSCALSRGVPMEPARLPFLLCVVDLQHLCAGRDRYASAAGANSGTGRERAKIYPRRHHRPIRLELDLSVDC